MYPALLLVAMLAGAAVAQADTGAGNQASQARPAGQTHSPLPRIPLEINTRTISVEVAIDDASHARGLMFRETLGRDDGMLFLFATPYQACFWMKNTLLPLTVAFIDAEGVIVNLADMQPQSLDTHCALAPVQYALEMNQGWFKRNDAGPGTRVLGLPRRLPAAPG